VPDLNEEDEVNLGRDKLPWSSELWDRIDAAVHDEMQRIRVLAKVLPTRPLPDASSVPADNIDLDTLKIAEGEVKPFIEISLAFELTQGQVDDEADLGTCHTLARFAAKSVALAEDMIFLRGERADALPRGVQVLRSASAANGLLKENEAAASIDVPTLVGEAGAPARPGILWGEHTFAALTEGISRLVRSSQPGSYALILETSVYADTYVPMPGQLTTTADRIIPLVPGGFYGTGTLPRRTGLLISLGGEPTTVAVAQDAITAFTQTTQEGDYSFRVFERVQFVARDPRAFLRLEFAAPPGAEEAERAVEVAEVAAGDGARDAAAVGADGEAGEDN
jgi:uncharacterized linocin/CFP29 family protein